MRKLRRRHDRGSGLILALGVLALLAIIATTFITLMRIDARLTRTYCDDVTTEMLAEGVQEYALAVLRDDQDRTLYKYENRDQAVGGRQPGKVISLPGRNTDYLAPEAFRYGIPASNDVWFHTDASTNTSYSNAYTEVGLLGAAAVHGQMPQGSFGGNDERIILAIVDRNDGYIIDPANQGGPDRYHANVWGDDNRRDDDGDGAIDELDERYTLTKSRFNRIGFLTHGGRCFLHPGGTITGTFRICRGMYWRWAAKIGVPEERYMNLNVIGNNEMLADGAARLDNLDGRGLHAVNADATTSPNQIGILGWRGYPGEYVYKRGGFPALFNMVQYAPSQLDPSRLLSLDYYALPYTPGAQPTALVTGGLGKVSVQKARSMAQRWIAQRWGEDSLPADGTDRWRVGWRRDGASYYKIPSPDNPMGNDHYFGASEALCHQNEDIVSGTSRVFDTVFAVNGGNVSNLNQARMDFGLARPILSTYGGDTILRGKIWPEEGWLPWRTSGTPGDWRHTDILKRVNLNIIGARGPEGLPGEDAGLKARWALKRVHEQNRLYFMLRAMLRWSNTASPSHEACQFIASLTDMVDRDQKETYYAAPDGSGNWALGVEKHPVIHEVVLHLNPDANTADYSLFRIRVELYNPCENIPWIPDADEAYDIRDYVLRIGPHNYRLGELRRFGTDANVELGPVTTIGADGMYGEPQPRSTTSDPTWSRYVHMGWPLSGVHANWPPLLTKSELEGGDFSGVEISLWKPLSSADDDGNPAGKVPVSPGKVEDISLGGGSRRYIRVDRTGKVRLVRPYGPGTGRNGPGGSEKMFVGIYRRWDPMNGRHYGKPDETNLTEREKSSVLWCPGWHLGSYATLGRPNTDYPRDASSWTYQQWNKISYSLNMYERRFEMNWKVVDGDLPSVGWLGELCLRNCAQDGLFTWVHDKGQNPHPTSGRPAVLYSNRFENKVKLDLFRPWDNPRNLHLYEMFTVWDPSNDGIDNDGDGMVDDGDSGHQAGDLLGPEVRVYGLIDVNQAGVRPLQTLMPGDRHINTYIFQRWGGNNERGRPSSEGNTLLAMGPRDSIGDLLRMDLLSLGPGRTIGGFGTVPGDWKNNFKYISSYNLYTGNPYRWGYGLYKGYDDDGDGIVDERDERDYLFTQMANFITTRAHTFTVEIVAQLTEPPYYQEYTRPTYKVDRVHAEKHLILLVDRSTTLRIAADGSCDFTGPIRILAKRWGQPRR